jgi:hypothetical protein
MYVIMDCKKKHRSNTWLISSWLKGHFGLLVLESVMLL